MGPHKSGVDITSVHGLVGPPPPALSFRKDLLNPGPPRDPLEIDPGVLLEYRDTPILKL